jgi:uncharacterized protein (DUF302 family)
MVGRLVSTRDFCFFAGGHSTPLLVLPFLLLPATVRVPRHEYFAWASIIQWITGTTFMPLRSLVAFSLLLSAACAFAQSDPVVEVKARGTFEDVKQMLVLAIENHGLVVNHQSAVGDMLERTGKDIGAAKRIYERAEMIEFCSANLSRQVMEADHRLLAFCPYGVGIYTLPNEPGTVHLVYRRPRLDGDGPAARALKQVDQLLHDVVQEAAQ